MSFVIKLLALAKVFRLSSKIPILKIPGIKENSVIRKANYVKRKSCEISPISKEQWIEFTYSYSRISLPAK